MKRRGNWKTPVRSLAGLLLVTAACVAWVRMRRGGVDLDLPTATAKKGDFPVIVRCRGTLRAARKVDLTAPLDVPDLQIVWLAPSGSDVKPGDVVIRFDPSKLEQTLREKTQALKQAQATLDQVVAQAKIDADQDLLDLAKARADMEKARLEASKQTIVSAIQGAESSIDYRMAAEKVKIQLSTTALHQESNRAKVASQTRLRDQAKSELTLVERRLAQIQVRTPIKGIVSYLPNTTQGWMNATNYKIGDHAYPGATIAEIPDLLTLEMESKVDEEDRGHIAVGNAVLVHVDAFPERTLDASLSSISPLTEQSFEEWPPTRSFLAYARIQHPDKRMRPGMNAGADIIRDKISGAISIPTRAVFTVDGKPTVYIKSPHAYQAVQINIVTRNPDEVAIAGIPAGTIVALVQPPEAK